MNRVFLILLAATASAPALAQSDPLAPIVTTTPRLPLPSGLSKEWI